MPFKLTPQKPPYYEEKTLLFNRLKTETLEISTAGTATTQLYSYTIPKNTLTKTGDTIIFNLIGIADGPAVDSVYNFQVKLTVVATVSLATNLYFKWTVEITRIANDKIQVTMYGGTNGAVTQLLTVTVSSMDFTIDTFTRWSFRAPTSGTLTTKLAYINKPTQS